jgi:hypothetical protein
MIPAEALRQSGLGEPLRAGRGAIAIVSVEGVFVIAVNVGVVYVVA